MIKKIIYYSCLFLLLIICFFAIIATSTKHTFRIQNEDSVPIAIEINQSVEYNLLIKTNKEAFPFLEGQTSDEGYLIVSIRPAPELLESLAEEDIYQFQII